MKKYFIFIALISFLVIQLIFAITIKAKPVSPSVLTSTTSQSAEKQSIQSEPESVKQSQPKRSNLSFCFNVDLKFGMRGNNVKNLQKVLRDLGIYKGPISGFFDRLTKSAVIIFQNKYAKEILIPAGVYTANGFVGPFTRAKLNNLFCTTSQLPIKDSYRSQRDEDRKPTYLPATYLLNHRFSSGDQLEFTVDTNRILTKTNRKVLGVSFFLVGDGPIWCRERDGDRGCRPGENGYNTENCRCFTGLPIDYEGNYTLVNYPSGNFEEPIKNLNLQATRVHDFNYYDRFIHAGKDKDAFYARFDAKTGLDKWHYLAQRLNIPEENIVIGLHIYTDMDGNIYPLPNFWQDFVRYSVSKGYKFKRWEIGNEIVNPISERESGFILNGFFNRYNLSQSVSKYKDYFIKVSEAIKKVQPDAQFAISINGDATLKNRNDDDAQYAWNKVILEELAGYYDFIVGHYYLGGQYEVDDNNFERHVLTFNYAMMQLELDILKYARGLKGNKNRFIYHYDTEWGSHALRKRWGESDVYSEVRNGNLFGSIARAIRLIYYLRENIVEGASTWAMIERDPDKTPAFGLLTHNTPNKRSMTYWLYYYFNQFLGEWILDIQGTAPYKTEYSFEHWPWYTIDIVKGPYTPVLASKSQDEKTVYLIIANGNETTNYNFQTNFVGFQGTKIRGIIFNDFRTTNWKDNNPFSFNQSDFIREYSPTLSPDGKILKGQIPAHSVLFLKVDRQ